MIRCGFVRGQQIRFNYRLYSRPQLLCHAYIDIMILDISMQNATFHFPQSIYLNFHSIIPTHSMCLQVVFCDNSCGLLIRGIEVKFRRHVLALIKGLLPTHGAKAPTIALLESRKLWNDTPTLMSSRGENGNVGSSSKMPARRQDTTHRRVQLQPASH